MIAINMLKSKTYLKCKKFRDDFYFFTAISVLRLASVSCLFALNKNIELWGGLCQGHTHVVLDI